jgi:2-C-methyl-D-erythritol 4-phosphate cytidylyltransferase
VPRYIALVPAAGIAQRMGDGTPKQYLHVAGRPLIEHTLRALAADSRIASIFVVLAPGDTHFRTLSTGDHGGIEALYCGGETRAASVYNGLVAVRDGMSGDDWVLVHDAARPCLSAAALSRLIGAIGENDAGGLLAIPVADTLKRGDGENHVVATEPRDDLWQAQTPQMFRFGVLAEALARTPGATDEAAAIEAIGLRPKLVPGAAENIKVTHPGDFAIAAALLALRAAA